MELHTGRQWVPGAHARAPALSEDQRARTRHIYRKHNQRHATTAALPHDAAHMPRTLLCRVML